MAQLAVRSFSRSYRVQVEVLEHDCYEDPDYTVESYTFYQPTQEQINNNTDHDETGYMAVCQKVLGNGEICGEDMPHIDLVDYGIDDGPDPDDDYDRMADR